MLRSAASAGASLADAETNANAAVLAHSVLFIPNLDATHPALENRHRRTPARGVYQRAALRGRFPGPVARTPQVLTPGGFSANLPSTCGPGLGRPRWPGQARWHTSP